MDIEGGEGGSAELRHSRREERVDCRDDGEVEGRAKDGGRQKHEAKGCGRVVGMGEADDDCSSGIDR